MENIKPKVVKKIIYQFRVDVIDFQKSGKKIKTFLDILKTFPNKRGATSSMSLGMILTSGVNYPDYCLPAVVSYLSY